MSVETKMASLTYLETDVMKSIRQNRSIASIAREYECSTGKIRRARDRALAKEREDNREAKHD